MAHTARARTAAADYATPERFQLSTRVMIDLQKAAGDVAKWQLQLSSAVRDVVGIEVDSVSFSGLQASASPGEPYVPYFSLVLTPSSGGTTPECRIARVNGQRESELLGMPVILSNSGYDHHQFDDPILRAYSSYEQPIGSFEHFQLRIEAAPLAGERIDVPKFTRVTILLRLLTPPVSRFIRTNALVAEYTSEMQAADLGYGTARGSTYR